MHVLVVAAFLGVQTPGVSTADEKKPVTVAEALKKVDVEVWVELHVKTTKNRLERRQEIYLDSEVDFRSPKNLGVVITKVGAERFKEAGIDDPAVRFKDKTIRVKGKLTIKEKRPRIEVDDPKQIEIVEKK
jgi:hypothetical protein